MRERDVRDDLKKGIVKNKYLIASSEPLLTDNFLKSIREILSIDEAFDCEAFSISETAVEDIMPNLYLTPIASKYRLTIIKNLEDLDTRTLPRIAQTMNKIRTANIIVMTCRIEKQGGISVKRLTEIFKDVDLIDIDAENHDVDRWIKARLQRDGIELPSELQRYLEEEFNNDITGLKNELDKIENYLYESSSLNSETLKDLATGLSEVDRYRTAKYFFSGSEKALNAFRQIAPYTEPAAIVYALGRSLLYSAANDRKRMQMVLKNLIDIDRKIKSGSYFSNLMLEMLFLQNTSLYKKGVSHG